MLALVLATLVVIVSAGVLHKVSATNPVATHAEGAPDLRDRVVLITGASSGIGYEATRQLVGRNATVVMACRDLEKGKAAKATIAKEMNERKGPPYAGQILLEGLDLVDKASIEDFCRRIAQLELKLTHVVLNAGVGFFLRPQTLRPSGLDLCFATNVLGHHHLIDGLWDQILRHGTHIVSVSSCLHRRVAFPAGLVDAASKVNWLCAHGSRWSPFESLSYAKSKLGNLLLTQHWAKALAAAGSDGKAVALHPGVVRSGLSRNVPLIFRALMNLALSLLGMTADKGAAPIVAICTSEHLVNGAYYGPSGGREEPSAIVMAEGEALGKALADRCRAEAAADR